MVLLNAAGLLHRCLCIRTKITVNGSVEALNCNVFAIYSVWMSYWDNTVSTSTFNSCKNFPTQTLRNCHPCTGKGQVSFLRNAVAAAGDVKPVAPCVAPGQMSLPGCLGCACLVMHVL